MSAVVVLGCVKDMVFLFRRCDIHFTGSGFVPKYAQMAS